MVCFIVYKHLVAQYAGSASDSKLVIIGNAEVALPVFGLLLVGKHLDSFLKGVVKKLLDFRQVLADAQHDVLGQVLSALIEIHMKAVSREIVPVKFLVLHPVLSEFHIGTRIKLTPQAGKASESR